MCVFVHARAGFRLGLAGEGSHPGQVGWKSSPSATIDHPCQSLSSEQPGSPAPFPGISSGDS